MATINTYNSQIIKVDNSNLLLRTSAYYPSAVIIPANETDTLTNTLSNISYSVPSNDPTHPFPSLMNSGLKTFPLSSSTIFGEVLLPDGVYHLSLNAIDYIDPTISYESNSYQLFTYNIDAAWGLFQTLYDPNDAANLATYNAITFSYATINTLKNNLPVNYAAINTQITNIVNELAAAVINYDGTPTLTLQSPTTFNLSVDYQVADVITASSSTIVGMANTGTKSNFPDISQIPPISTTATAASLFSLPVGSLIPDSVYYVDMVSEGTYIGEYDSARAYCLVTTMIDYRWGIFQSIYNPNDPSNVATYNTVSTAYATIDTLSSDLATNYTAINAQITIITNALATITVTFDSTATLTSATTMTVSTDYTASVIVEGDLTITNTTTNDFKVYNPYPQLDIANSGTKTKSFASGSPLGSPNFSDGIYNVSLYYSDADTINCNSTTNYVLVTTAIDAAIAAYPQTTLFEIANKMAMVQLRADLDVAFNNENYTECNYLLSQISNYLLSASATTETSSLTLSDSNTLTVVITAQATTPITAQYNAAYNTNGTNEIDATFYDATYGIPTGGGSTSIDSNDFIAQAYYPDGVWANYIYLLGTESFYAEPFTSISFALVTTTIDAQFAVFEANYDPNNTAQAASYQAMLTAFATINTLSNDLATNYAAINTQIQYIQSQLALFVTLNMTLVYNKNTSNLDLTIVTSLPNVTYSNQSLVVVGNDTKYVSSTFPSSYIDTTLAISSTMFGAYLADGVYQANLSWNTANDMEFSGVTYGLITENIDCGIAKYSAKIVKACNDSALKTSQVLLTYRKMVDLAFAAGDYATAATLIGEIQIMLTKLKCNC